MQTIDERRAKNAAKQRAYRARKAAERAAAKAAAGNGGGVTEPPTTMRDALEEALLGMKWLTDSDVASKAQARLLAEQVDVLGHRGDTIRMLSAHRALSQVLSDLAGTPKVRLQHELRSARVTAKRGGDDVGNSEGEAAGNVSAFKRPEKRTRS